MSRPIENYALISDCHSCALIDRNGSVDWLAFPCFDSAACFASLLGTHEHGHWSITPKHTEFSSIRHYIDKTMVLETIFKTPTGKCKVIDCMVMNSPSPTFIRTIEGLEGKVELQMELIIRFNYGSIVPWVTKNVKENGMHAVAGPEAIVLYPPQKLQHKHLQTFSDFDILPGEKKFFTMIWYPSHSPMPGPLHDPWSMVECTIEFWRKWASQCEYNGYDAKSVRRNLMTLKALTYDPTGAIVAAPTTSLPESIGGKRNWDYRYSWIRDSSFTLYALLRAGYREEAKKWRSWLLRAVAGTPSQMNIMYGIRGERRLTELELTWLPGYENSRPVRIGNDAYKQTQLDIFGELIATTYMAQKNGIPVDETSWRIIQNMADYVCQHWAEPDEGIWEVRGPRRHFVHSKLMAWLALKSALKCVFEHHLHGDHKRWSEVKDLIHREICEKGYSSNLNAFVQYFGSDELDASVLMMGHVDFLPPDDPRWEAISKHLMSDGFLLRYKNTSHVDGLPGNEGAFITCSFWLVDNLRMMGRIDETFELYERLQKIKNDLGLYAEEYSTHEKRMVDNFPQALSHIAETMSAIGLDQVTHLRRAA